MPQANESALCGKHGKLRTPESTLPDFSQAGSKHGETPPDLPAGTSVRDFGAKGDGSTDDTAAFQQALSQVQGAVDAPWSR